MLVQYTVWVKRVAIETPQKLPHICEQMLPIVCFNDPYCMSKKLLMNGPCNRPRLNRTGAQRSLNRLRTDGNGGQNGAGIATEHSPGRCPLRHNSFPARKLVCCSRSINIAIGSFSSRKEALLSCHNTLRKPWPTILRTGNGMGRQRASKWA